MMQKPLVTVIMPIRNEGAYISRCLQAVIDQDYPPELVEIIVADGMSTDNTREILNSFRKRYDNIAVIDNPKMIVPTGMNLGIESARGEIIVRVDGHTTIAPNYLGECVAALQRSKAQNVGGRMTATSVGLFGRATALATSSRFGIGDASFHYSDREEWVDTVYMGAWPREVFTAIGLFDEEQVRNQDDEFNYRLLAHGGKILLSPQIESRYYNRSTLRLLWRQYFQYGYWKVRVIQKHPRQMRWRQGVPAFLILALLVSFLASLVLPGAVWLLVLILGSYAIANALATVMTAPKVTSARPLLLLPVAFFAIHFAYGIGFTLGLVRFWSRWWDNQPAPNQNAIIRFQKETGT